MLLIANKQDLPGALPPVEVKLPTRYCTRTTGTLENIYSKFVELQSATDGASVHTAMHKLCDMIKEKDELLKRIHFPVLESPKYK